MARITSNKRDLIMISLFARLSSIVIIVWALTFLSGLLYGWVSIGHIPKYGTDNDPYSLNSVLLGLLQMINQICFYVGVVALPAWTLLKTHLILNRVAITSTGLFINILTIISILVFCLFKFVWEAQYLWFYD